MTQPEYQAAVAALNEPIDPWAELYNMATRDPAAFERLGVLLPTDQAICAIWNLLGRMIRENAGREQGPKIITLGAMQ